MTPTEIMNVCQQSGVALRLDAEGGLILRGSREKIARLAPTIRQHKSALLAALTGKQTDPCTMAEEIAKDFGIEATQALQLLDDDDNAMIQAGDQATIDAWRCAVESRVRQGIWVPLQRTATP